MTILGLSAGNRGGSAEILLKEALKAAEDAGANVELVRVDDLRLNQGPEAGTDDGPWFWDRLMESDALIVSTPIYSRTVPGKLRLLGDKISGPQADVAFTSELLRMRAAGEPVSVNFEIDERVLRSRIGAYIAVGGSIPPRWKTLALPLLHTISESMQMAIVDQVQFAGAGSPKSIVLDEEALERARQLGRNVAEQLGRDYADAEYRGEKGVCPLCHLDVIAIVGDGLECATCGARGEFSIVDGAVAITFTPEGLAQSVLDRGEKLDHFREVQDTARRHAPERERIDTLARAYEAFDPSIRPGAGVNHAEA
jgi:multimeric flavodoxin WrbA